MSNELILRKLITIRCLHIQKFRMDSQKWVLAKRKDVSFDPQDEERYIFRLPIRALAPKGDIESYYWNVHKIPFT